MPGPTYGAPPWDEACVSISIGSGIGDPIFQTRKLMSESEALGKHIHQGPRRLAAPAVFPVVLRILSLF